MSKLLLSCSYSRDVFVFECHVCVRKAFGHGDGHDDRYAQRKAAGLDDRVGLTLGLMHFD